MGKVQDDRGGRGRWAWRWAVLAACAVGLALAQLLDDEDEAARIDPDQVGRFQDPYLANEGNDR